VPTDCDLSMTFATDDVNVARRPAGCLFPYTGLGSTRRTVCPSSATTRSIFITSHRAGHRPPCTRNSSRNPSASSQGCDRLDRRVGRVARRSPKPNRCGRLPSAGAGPADWLARRSPHEALIVIDQLGLVSSRYERASLIVTCGPRTEASTVSVTLACVPCAPVGLPEVPLCGKLPPP
jgi:hypothetical protein